MKILQVIDQLGLGGAERVCVNLTNVLYKNNYNVKIVVFNNKGVLFNLLNKKVDVVILNKNKNKFKAYKRLIKEIKEADIVHIHMRQNFKYVKKTLLAFGVKKKLILHDHFGEIAINKRIPTFYKSYYQPDYYIGCSELLTNWATDIVGLKQEKVTLINNFVLQHKSTNKPIKNKLGGIFVGSMKPVKNHIFAIKLAKKIGVDLTIYCGETNSRYFKNLCEEIDSLDYSKNVHFVHNCINIQSELYKYDFAFLTSTSEGDPLVLIEYIAQGLPFLSYNTGEAAKLIKHHFPDFVLDNFNENDWIENFQKIKKIKKEDILKVYKKYYDTAIFLQKYISVYKKLM